MLSFADEAFGLVLQANHGSKRIAPGMPIRKNYEKTPIP